MPAIADACRCVLMCRSQSGTRNQNLYWNESVWARGSTLHQIGAVCGNLWEEDDDGEH